VTSFHELCVEHYTRQHGAPDFTRPSLFQTLTESYCAAAPARPPRYDLIIIDEGQDFEPDWVASLLPQLREDARLYVLEDDAQRLYERDGFDLDGAVMLSCHDNFRSPRAICQVINALRLSDRPVEGAAPTRASCPVSAPTPTNTICRYAPNRRCTTSSTVAFRSPRSWC
jgi:hypothetical protein